MICLSNIIENIETSNIVTGSSDSFFGLYLYNLLNKFKKNIYVVVNSLYEANIIYDNTCVFTNDVFLFPMDDFLTSEALAISPDLLINRMETLKKIEESNNPKIIITNLMGYLRFLPSKKKYEESIIRLKVGDEISPGKLSEKLLFCGYKRNSIVTNTGEYGVRGYVIDIFPLGDDNPFRIEFFGDEIISIRTFDPVTQTSLEQINFVVIYPYYEFLCDDFFDERKIDHKYLSLSSQDVVSLKDYLDNPLVVYKDYQFLEVAYRNLAEQIFNYRVDNDKDFSGQYMFDFYNIFVSDAFFYSSINNIDKNHMGNEAFHFNIKSILPFNDDVSKINDFIRKNICSDYTVIICVSKQKMRNIISNLNMIVYESSIDSIKKGCVNIVNLELNEGFIFKDLIFLSEKELFHTIIERKRYKTKFKYSTKITDLNKLSKGDYVVHLSHGIGVYNGITKLEFNGIEKDYIEVLYMGNDKLYIPVEKIDNLSKYSGKEGVIPKINKLNGSEWHKTKARVSKKICDLADELISLYAERESKKGFSFSSDNSLMRQFEEDFPYLLTNDQLKAIKQVKFDMESIKPMDRLLCGDVGFGKTEVAFVAAFKAILDSKQVFLLCPTTILSNQHYQNALNRFSNFPVNIRLLNRFTSPKEVKAIINDLKNGIIDFLIGTHRILSDDIQPNDLGLLIIDEEQRFGVKHKEKMKQYKKSIDVLTLSATPIPRTLQMSMAGLRSLSLIETPPVDRYPIQTYVVEENKIIIKDAIYKELSRNGQVFVLYNRVEDIEKKSAEINQIVPDARVIFAHGRMPKDELEDKMVSFINHEYDILVCTTIIETGIDIPNVNTLIVLNADRFGLSQLYQIRGRVGRSNKFAYAYLMYEPFKSLSETAIKRLNVIKEFTELGSGFSIATRDLSIRGAGDILGSEQAGFMDSVGVDLYLQMLNDEINIRQGKTSCLSTDDDSQKPYINVNTHIKDSYVDDENLKIEIHRLINTIDSGSALESVKLQIEDRFGVIDNDMDIYMHEEWFEKLVKKLEIRNVRETKNFIEIIFDKSILNKVSVEQLFIDVINISNMFRFQTRGETLIIILDTIKLDRHPIYYLVDLLELIDK